MPALDILVADDHTLLRQGLCRILESQSGWRVVAQASTGHDAVRLALEHAPGVAILDIAMPMLNGIEATRQLARQLPDLRVLILSMHAEEAYITQALQAGAQGYLMKDAADVELIQAVGSVAAGTAYFSPAVSRVLLDDYVRQLGQKGPADRFDLLTEREREIFQLIAEGHGNKSIATILSVSPATVETHRARIFSKLDIHSVAALVMYAVRRGVIS